MASMRVSALFRFPLKGFPAEQINAGFARAGSGFDGDRAFAFTTGAAPAVPGQWAGPRTFTVLKNDTSLQQWQVHTRHDVSAPEAGVAIGLQAPDGKQVSFSIDEPESLRAAEDFLAARLTPHGPHRRELVSADQGMFDSQVSGLSIINPATAQALEGLAGGPVDPLRFRGNILIDGLPAFAEFGLVGKRLRIGGVEAVVRSPIERCSATEVDPTSGAADLPIPRLLAAGCGHLHCGIYLSVTTNGEIRPGDRIEILGEAPAEALKRQTAPREMSVEAVDCREGVAEIRLRDDLGFISDFYSPGMHVRVHLPDSPAGTPTWRCYTVTGVTGNALHLRVRIRTGVSHRLAGMKAGDRLLVSGPFGQVTADRLGDEVVFLTAGIGITPALSLLPGLAGRQVRILHSERSPAPSRLWEELTDLAAGMSPAPELTRRCTDPAHDGSRLSAAELACHVGPSTSLVICGPPAFTAAAIDAAAAAGLAAEQLHTEIFTSPADMTRIDLSRYAPGAGVPATVTTASGTVFDWTPEQGMLLDALERRDVDVDSLCRAGACGKCALTLRAGQIAYPIEPSAPRDADEVLVCSAVPLGPVEIDV